MGYYSKREITIWAYIYILTNPSFPQYVKIGYAADVKQRLDELNRSPAVPFAFRVYATYEVDSALSDKKLHTILDKLNPELRSMEEVDGEKRIREFYAMTPEDAYAIMEAIAEINGYKHRLKKWKATAAEQKDEAMAQEIDGLLGIDQAKHADWHADSIAVRGYEGIDARTGSISYPLYQSATFAHPAWGESTGYCYSRCGNPTRLELENTIALLEGGKKCMAFSSGMAAIATLL